MKKILILTLALICFSSAAEPFKVGDIPFDLVGKDSNGNEVKVSDYKGQVVIVSF
jgi:cytochrome oxidase Cu insertion factor (SCO1/SenC/PrrC family)